jgi:hypothetical protein
MESYIIFRLLKIEHEEKILNHGGSLRKVFIRPDMSITAAFSAETTPVRSLRVISFKY